MSVASALTVHKVVGGLREEAPDWANCKPCLGLCVAIAADVMQRDPGKRSV